MGVEQAFELNVMLMYWAQNLTLLKQFSPQGLLYLS